MKNSQSSSLKNILKFSTVIVITWIGFYLITFIVTPSIDKTVLVLDVFTNKPIKTNDYVRFILDHELIGGKHAVVKLAGCIEGQLLARKEDAFYCDEKRLVPVRLRREKKDNQEIGDLLPQLYHDGIIPPGKLFVHGTDQYSFDSRHWGFVNIQDARRMIPIF